MAAPSLAPPDTTGLPGPFGRWLKLLWDVVRGDANLDSTLGTVANTKGAQTLQNKTLTNIKDNTRCYVRASTAAGQSIPNGAQTVVDFGTKELDSRSAVTTGAGWKFTVPAGHGGVYLVSAVVTLAAGAASLFVVDVFKNGSWLTRLSWIPSTAADAACSGSTLLSLAAGDYIDFRVFQSSGGARSLFNDAKYNHVSIIRLVTDL